MKKEARHIIRKQLVDLRVTEALEGARLQHKVSELMNGEVVAIMERLLNSFDKDKEWIQIDRLELDLGHLDKERLEEDLLQKMEDSLRQALQDKLNAAPASDGGTGVQRSGAQLSVFEAFQYYLHNGVLPWWSPAQVYEELEERMLDMLSQNPQHQLKIGELARQYPAIRHRLIHQCAFELLMALDIAGHLRWFDQLFNQFGEYNLSVLRSIKTQAYEQILAYDLSIAQLPVALLDSIFERSAQAFAQAVNVPIATWAIQQLAELHNEKPEVLALAKPVYFSQIKKVLGTLAEGEATRPKNEESQQVSPESVHDLQSQIPDNKTSEQTSAGNKDLELEHQTELPDHTDLLSKNVFSNNQSETERSLFVPPLQQQTGNYPIDLEEGIYATMAGLVLLHPFLNTLFEALDWVKKGQFITEATKEKAIHYLGWLATDQEGLAETELVIPKLLCGCPLRQPITRHLYFTEEEKAPGIELLEAVINHWDALKNTTPQGLQTAFLLREGKITSTKEGLHLQVEEMTMDILLGRIPWGFSIIRLPWMNSMLFVNWH